MLGGHAGFLILCTSVPHCKRCEVFSFFFFIKAKFLNDVGRGFIRSDHKKVWTEKLSYRKWVWVLVLLPLCLCACVCVRCLCFVLSPDGFVLSLRWWCQERLLCFSGKKKSEHWPLLTDLTDKNICVCTCSYVSLFLLLHTHLELPHAEHACEQIMKTWK